MSFNKAAFLVVAIAATIGLMASGGVRTAHAQQVDCVNTEAGPLCISLEPQTTINPVGTDHTVTATVTEDDVAVAAFSVTILVFDGPNAGAIAQGKSDQDGKFSLTYTGDGGQGTDDIIAIACEREGACGLQIDLCLGLPEACVANTEGNCLDALDCDVDVATKDWVEPTPTPPAPGCVLFEEQEFCISLEPETASNTVDTDHTVTATLTLDDNPLAEEPVAIFVIDGPNEVALFEEGEDFVLDLTNDSGALSLTYTGDGGTGTDIIVAVAFCELGETGPFCALFETEGELVFLEDTATKDWVNPTPTPTPGAATPTPTPTVLAATATPTPTPTPAVLPASGGTPFDGGSGALPWLAAIAGAIALIGSGAWIAYQRRRVR